jgi:probable HAF family extracellular repeat protein
MKSKTLASIIGIILFGALALSLPLAAQEEHAKHDHYKVIDLKTLGGTFSVAFAINDRGWIAGTATLPGDKDRHAFLWRRGRKTDLRQSGQSPPATP